MKASEESTSFSLISVSYTHLDVYKRQGVRFDYVLADPDKTFLNELAKYHVSGQLRVAPEHVSNQVLKYMGKPSHEVYEKFLKEFDKANKKAGLQQFAVPYFMSSHPGCTCLLYTSRCV